MTEKAGTTFAAVLVAGGSGTRFSKHSASATAKQFIMLAARPMYVWSLQALLETPQIDHLVMVVPPSMVASIDQDLDLVREKYHSKHLIVAAGGASRQASVHNGLLALNTVAPNFVLIHDAARPFLTHEIIKDVIDGVIKYGAVTTGIRVTDTIKTFADDFVDQTVARDTLLVVQTPQAAHYDWLLEAHDLAAKAGNTTTDDAGILEAAGHKVGIVRGASINFKITNAEDLILANALATIVFADRL